MRKITWLFTPQGHKSRLTRLAAQLGFIWLILLAAVSGAEEIIPGAVVDSDAVQVAGQVLEKETTSGAVAGRQSDGGTPPESLVSGDLTTEAADLIVVTENPEEGQPETPVTGDATSAAAAEAEVLGEVRSEPAAAEIVAEPTEIKIAQKDEQDVPFWVKIRTRIEKITPQKKPSVTTAVGGVRGAKNEAGKELYWKGEEVPSHVTEQELAKFDQALQKAENGEIEEARRLFEDFVTEFPASELNSDALLALQKMEPVGGDGQ